MTDDEKAQLTAELLGMAAAFSKPYRPEAIDQVVEDLEDLPLPVAMGGIRAARRSCRYRPTVAEIREQAEAYRRTRTGPSPSTVAAITAGELHCRRCEDTGWQWVRAATGEALDAPPAGTHADYRVRPCACRAHNLIYQARHRS